ncbi:hypothetical protein K474DRAFT_1636472 [Panus rudis PR-1116 ss-1]|nr:hypothetical protein K474DRAFT_1636472 [Panus rudis PR-1116 ss-1]
MASSPAFGPVQPVLPSSQILSDEGSEGLTCSSNNNRLDSSTHRFTSDCDDKTFCSAAVNGTCQPRECRRDEFPFGFQADDVLPPLCSDGSFCPDEGDGCKDLVAVGQPCQLNRDDQCAPPDNWEELSSPQNFNGSLCLQSTCVYANATLGQSCILDSTAYIDIGPDSQHYTNVITRHNCQTPQFYCDPDAKQCMPTLNVGETCVADQECSTYNCDPSGVCMVPPEVPLRVATWQYALTIVVLFAAMASVVVMLVMVHQRIRLRRYAEIREYYDEQLSLRRTMFALHAAADEQQLEEKRSLRY